MRPMRARPDIGIPASLDYQGFQRIQKQLSHLFQCAPVLARRHSGDSLERRAEVAGAREAAFVGDVGGLGVWVAQQQLGGLSAANENEPDGRVAGSALERPAEMETAHGC